MGNALSEEEQEQIMEEAYNLEDPGTDKHLNSGTSAPNCQPKHTQRELEPNINGGSSEGDETSMTHKNQRTASTASVRDAQDERRKRQHTSASSSSLSSQQQQEQEMTQQEKKLSYFQMARLGYQELVNAIIRPPRADYKVRFSLSERLLF